MFQGSMPALVTPFKDDAVDFESWWYARDPTHVAFYTPATLEWIARDRGWAIHRPGPTVALFRKAPAGSP